jgi:hypothetical protein
MVSTNIFLSTLSSNTSCSYLRLREYVSQPFKTKLKVKLPMGKHHNMEAYNGQEGFPCILDLGTRSE